MLGRFFFYSILASSSAIAGSSPELSRPQIAKAQFEVVVHETASGPNSISGSVTWSSLTPDSSRQLCFYLPYEDPEYGTNHGSITRFEYISGRQPQAHLLDGSLKVHNRSTRLDAMPSVHDQVLRLKVPEDFGLNDGVKLDLEAKVPRARFSDSQDWFYDGFLPELLPDCNIDSFTHAHFTHSRHAHFKGILKIPESWLYRGPGTTLSQTSISIDQLARTYSFALQKSKGEISFESNGIPIIIHPRSKGFGSLESTIKEMLPRVMELLGPPPFKSLTILETSEIQRSSINGIIAINRPAQAIFEKIQEEWLNWRHWTVTTQLVKQWYGGSIVSHTPDDDWLIDGLAEFVTMKLLASSPNHWDLFKPLFGTKKPLSLNYLQMNDIFASFLRQGAPFASLTDASFSSRDTKQKQHDLLFIKQAFALRQLANLAGEENFFAMIRNMNRDTQFKSLSPKEFSQWIERRPSPFPPTMREELKNNLRVWWTSDSWPDFTLSKFEFSQLADGKWLARTEASQSGGINFRPNFSIMDDAGNSYFTRGVSADDDAKIWYAEIITAGRPEVAMVDPSRVVYDSNRFDNSNESTKIEFFPGTANTLRDDAYTVLWAPYPLRRPGEPFSFGIGSSIRHYLTSGLSLRLEYAPSTHRGSYLIAQELKWPASALSATFSASHSYFNDRRLEAALTRQPILSIGPRFGASIKLRKKEEAGNASSSHYTYGFSLTARPESNTLLCRPNLVLEWEKAPGIWADNFSYERKTATVSSMCNFSRGTNLKLKAFAGAIDVKGTPPRTSQFRLNDLAEVGLRLDKNIQRVNRIAALETDLFLPLFLPIPRNLMILPRQMKGRIFYDLGISDQPHKMIRAGGAGFFLPLGGDLSGAGSLTISRVSLLAILYQDIHGEISRKPTVLFDLSGDL